MAAGVPRAGIGSEWRCWARGCCVMGTIGSARGVREKSIGAEPKASGTALGLAAGPACAGGFMGNAEPWFVAKGSMD